MKGLRLFGLLLFGVMSAMVASCGGDDDDVVSGGGDLSAPKYEAESALYKVTEAGTGYSSFELTSSGNYIIQKEGYSFYTRAAESRSEIGGFFLKPFAKTRSHGNYDRIIYGTYTVDGDTYKLDGFGTIVVVGGGKSAVTLDITTKEGRKLSIGAQKENQYSSSTMTNMLCRTWNINKFGLYASVGGKVIDETYPSYVDFMRAMLKLDGFEDGSIIMDNGIKYSVDLSDLAGKAPVQVIFTKSGSYIVFYSDQSLAISTWKWVNESTGVIRYSWDYSDINKSYNSGSINVEFKGNQLIVKEPFNQGGYDGGNYSITYLTEVK